MKLFVDDIREAPEGWTRAKTITEAINFIMLYGEDIKEISLDHDISFDVRVEGLYRPFPSPDTFETVACFIAIYYQQFEYRPLVTIHTANPVGKDRIEGLMIFYGIPYKVEMMGQAHRKK